VSAPGPQSTNPGLGQVRLVREQEEVGEPRQGQRVVGREPLSSSSACRASTSRPVTLRRGRRGRQGLHALLTLSPPGRAPGEQGLGPRRISSAQSIEPGASQRGGVVRREIYHVVHQQVRLGEAPLVREQVQGCRAGCAEEGEAASPARSVCPPGTASFAPGGGWRAPDAEGLRRGPLDRLRQGRTGRPAVVRGPSGPLRAPPGARPRSGRVGQPVPGLGRRVLRTRPSR